MIRKDTMNNTFEFFAAANGYDGFRSNFEKVFNPKNFTGIFILKGGPGTGKSTLMKSIYKNLSNLTDSNELIYCSSDTNSLDGIILNGKGGNIAVIDGTSPHATDPRYPGAVEKIINLGEFWDSKKLTDQREKIKKYSDEKSNAYSKAYGYLALAGKVMNVADKVVSDAFYETENRTRCNLKQDGGRLIDSFGKDGICEFTTLSKIAGKIIRVVGLFGSGELYLKTILNLYNSEDIEIYNSVFSARKIKAVYIKSEDIAYICTTSEEYENTQNIDATSLLNPKILKENQSYLEALYNHYESFLWSASDEFKKASEAHFLLEDIYKSTVDFSKISNLGEKLTEEIKDLIL